MLMSQKAHQLSQSMTDTMRGGIILMDQVPDDTPDCGGWEQYSDLSQKKLWKE